MADNIIKSTDVNPPADKKTKKETPKKASATKKTAPTSSSAAKKSDAAPNGVKDGYKIVVFESGTAYTSKNLRFTKDNRIQEVPAEDAEILLNLDNFRLPDQFEIEEYFNSRED